MQYRSVKGFTGWAQLGILFVGLLLGFLLASGVQLLIATLGMHLSVTDANVIVAALQKPENVNWARLFQVAGTFCIMFVPSVFYLWICHGPKWFWVGFNRHVNVYQLILGFGVMFFASALATPLSDLSHDILAHFPKLNMRALAAENEYNSQIQLLSNLKSGSEFAVALVVMAFLPGLFEELLFRGALQNLLNRWWKHALLSIIVSSLFFSFIHMSYYLFLSRALLGFALGWMFYRSKNIWVNVFAHFINNTLALSMLMIQSGKKPTTPNAVSEHLSWPVTCLFGLIVIVLLIGFDRVSKNNRTRIALREETLLQQSNLFYTPPSSNENLA